MKRQLFLLLQICVISHASAQEAKEKLLRNSWQLVQHSIMDSVCFPVSFSEKYSFYSDSCFQIERIEMNRDSLGNPARTTYITAGHWCVCKGKLHLRQVHNIPGSGWQEDYSSSFAFKGNLLIIDGYKDFDESKLILAPVPVAPKIRDTFQYWVPPLRYNYYLVKSTDSTKRTRIQGIEVSVPAYEHVVYYVKSTTDTTIELIQGVEPDKPSPNSYFYKDKGVTFQISGIGKITNHTNARFAVQLSGFGIAALGALTSLIIAPAVSIDYSGGATNTQRYAMWARAGLVGISVGIPLMILVKQKKYKVLPRYAPPQENHWYIVSEKRNLR